MDVTSLLTMLEMKEGEADELLHRHLILPLSVYTAIKSKTLPSGRRHEVSTMLS